ncbi:MAG: hypothetical protein WC010_01195 [Candidatus Absconditabacterales bacterium]
MEKEECKIIYIDDKKYEQKLYELSNHLVENLSMNKPIMRTEYKDGNEIIDQTNLDVFKALSDHCEENIPSSEPNMRVVYNKTKEENKLKEIRKYIIENTKSW